MDRSLFSLLLDTFSVFFVDLTLGRVGLNAAGLLEQGDLSLSATDEARKDLAISQSPLRQFYH
jgi:hypothetical protein